MKAKLIVVWMLVLLGAGLQHLQAQTPSQVIIGNGGPGGGSNKVRMAAWNLGTGAYTVFDSIPAGGISSIFIWGRDAYVCADSLLVRYNLDNYQREAMTTIHGIRRVAVWEDKVLVTKGLGAQNDHFEVRYADNLLHCFSLPQITGNCEGVVVVGDSGYVANPVSFLNPTGNMDVIDMTNRTLSRTMSLDTMGKFIDNLFLYQGKVVSVNRIKFNNPQWGFVSIFDPANSTFVHHKVNVPTSQGAGIDQGHLFASFNHNIGSFNLTTGLISDSVVVPGTWATSALDTVNDRIYLTDTDHATYGWLYGFDYTGNPTDTLEVGVSPDAIAIDYNVSVGMPPVHSTGLISSFPQPFADVLHVDLRSLPAGTHSIRLAALTGETLWASQAQGNGIEAIAMPELAAGMYLLSVQNRHGSWTAKVIKASH